MNFIDAILSGFHCLGVMINILCFYLLRLSSRSSLSEMDINSKIIAFQSLWDSFCCAISTCITFRKASPTTAFECRVFLNYAIIWIATTIRSISNVVLVSYNYIRLVHPFLRFQFRKSYYVAGLCLVAIPTIAIGYAAHSDDTVYNKETHMCHLAEGEEYQIQPLTRLAFIFHFTYHFMVPVGMCAFLYSELEREFSTQRNMDHKLSFYKEMIATKHSDLWIYALTTAFAYVYNYNAQMRSKQTHAPGDISNQVCLSLLTLHPLIAPIYNLLARPMFKRPFLNMLGKEKNHSFPSTTFTENSQY